MLFYADRQHTLDARETSDRAAEALSRAADVYLHQPGSPRSAALQTHADLVGAGIAFGELFQAVADRLNPERDDSTPELDGFATAGVLIGRCIYRSSRLLRDGPEGSSAAREERSSRRHGARGRGAGIGQAAGELLRAAAKAVSRASARAGGGRIPARIPEGFAFYCLYPEMYLANVAKALAAGSDAFPHCVVGIRSIGTSLATLVAGALRERGLLARVETVRPRGHPFDRYVELGSHLQRRLGRDVGSDARFLVVDEGPGLTCSSFLSVCAALARLGVGEERLSILSAWQGVPSVYSSEEGRTRWKRLRVFSTEAVEAFDGWRSFVPLVRQALGSDLTAQPTRGTNPDPSIEDLSYGRWRERCYPSSAQWPVVHRPAERAKVLYRFMTDSLPVEESRSEGMSILAKFAGLGDYGRRKYERALALGEAGFSPPVRGLAYGFLLYQFLEGARPMNREDLTPRLLARMADYYAFVAHRFRVPAAPRFDGLAEMLLHNTREALGLDASRFVASWRPRQECIDALPLALLDGRPQPHEWLQVGEGPSPLFLKADSSDHFHDHTLVGEQSVLWDLAGACEEWEMDETTRSALLDQWERRTGDRQAAGLIDFYRATYLAFRIAALHYAVHSTNEEDIRRSLQHEQWKSRQRLARLLA